MNKGHQLIKSWLQNHFPQTAKDPLTMGLEIEIPVNPGPFPRLDWVNVGAPSLMHVLMKDLNFIAKEYDLEGNVIALQNPLSGDQISFEFSRWIIEISLAPATNLMSLSKRYYWLYPKIRNFVIEQGFEIPSTAFNSLKEKEGTGVLKTPRNLVLHRHLKDHDPINWFFGSFITSIQTHLSCDLETLPLAMDVFSNIDWLRCLLFGNSNYANFRCYRQELWQNSFFGSNPLDIGLGPTEFLDVDSVCDYLAHQSLFYVVRDGQYIPIKPVSLIDFFESKYINALSGSFKLNDKTTLAPETADLNGFRSYGNIAVTKYGTIEVRGDCSQPSDMAFQPAAFNLGARLALVEISELLKPLSHSQWRNFRKMALTKSGALEIMKDPSLRKVADKILALIQQKLQERGYDEHHFLSTNNPFGDIR